MATPTLSGRMNSVLAEVFSALSLPVEHARVAQAQKQAAADLQCNGAMPVAKAVGRKPVEVAKDIAAALNTRAEIASAEVAGPGFINLTLAPALLSELAEAQAKDSDLAVAKAAKPEQIVIDFGGPNVAKPLHVGHLRSLVIGESLRRLLIAAGNEVVSDVHLGDWGLQMGQLISELELRDPSLPYFDAKKTKSYPKEPPVELADLEAMYPAAAAACKADSERLEMARRATAELQDGRPGYRALWKHFRELSLSAQRKDFDELAAHFDLFLGESDADPHIAPMLADLEKSGLAVEDQGAVVIHVAEESDGKRPLPPLILEKRDGAATYATTDLATIFQRVSGNPPAERILYVVDQRQADHFQQVFRAARKAGVSAKLEHVGFGTVNGKDGKALKTRAGGTVKLAELLDEAINTAQTRIEASEQGKELTSNDQRVLARQIGIGAVKFADLASNRVSGYVFDAERLVSFEGKTGPYLQYACVRLGRILAKAREQGKTAGKIAPAHPAERALVLDCLRFPDVVASAAASLLPSEIAEYAFTLAQKLSRFYTECPVLAEEDGDVRASRIAMCALAHSVLSRCLWLLGIGVPEKM